MLDCKVDRGGFAWNEFIAADFPSFPVHPEREEWTYDYQGKEVQGFANRGGMRHFLAHGSVPNRPKDGKVEWHIEYSGYENRFHVEDHFAVFSGETGGEAVGGFDLTQWGSEDYGFSDIRRVVVTDDNGLALDYACDFKPDALREARALVEDTHFKRVVLEPSIPEGRDDG